MPQLELTVLRAEPIYEGFAMPTIKFHAQAVNKAGDLIHFCYLSCDVYMKVKAELILGCVPIVLTTLPQNQSKNFEFLLSFNMDANNAIHEMIKHQEFEDVPFKLVFRGSCLWGPSGQPSSNAGDDFFVPPQKRQLIQEVGLPVDKYRRLLSAYYRNLSWISVSRETYSQIKNLMNRLGFTSVDELINHLISLSK